MMKSRGTIEVFVLEKLLYFSTWTIGRTMDVTIQTASGRIHGHESMFLGKHVRSFLGVPFAEPPIGDRRFRPPVPKKPWNGTLHADTLSPACYQGRDTTFGTFWGSDMWNANTPISEDCLYLNIWVPRTTLTKVPVMVWLFGGGFWYGSASLALYDGRGLAVEGHVIVVNINYRVGGFGFLFLDDEEVPGNMGLLDQQLALKWIQDNIKYFGGDRRKVTLFGESAGAASIVAHMIAPGSHRLFNNGILESGSLDNPWAMDSPEKALRKSMSFVKAAGCDQNGLAPAATSQMIKCLKQRSSANISDSLWYVPVGFMEFYSVIVSQDRNFFQGKDAFVALRERDYKPTDLIIGINRDEGNFWNIYYLNESYQFYPFNENSLKAPPHINGVEFEKCVEKAFARLPELVRQAVKFEYWDKQCTGNRDFYAEQANQMVGDYFFTSQKWMGVLHGFEIEYVFGVPLVNGTHGGYTLGEIELSRKIVQYWSNFARTGYPKADHKKHRWPLYDKKNKLWFRMSAEGIEVMNSIKADKCNLWRSARDVQYRKLVNGSSSLGFSKLLISLILIGLILCKDIH